MREESPRSRESLRTAPCQEVVRLAQMWSLLPDLGSSGRLTPEWIAWLSSLDRALERAEIAAREGAVVLSLDLRAVREDLDKVVTGSGADLDIDVETAEAVVVRALHLARRATD